MWQQKGTQSVMRKGRDDLSWSKIFLKVVKMATAELAIFGLARISGGSLWHGGFACYAVILRVQWPPPGVDICYKLEEKPVRRNSRGADINQFAPLNKSQPKPAERERKHFRECH
jgi:hypothetical protein